MANKDFNRYGEKDVRPGHFQHGGGIGTLFTGHPNSNQISMPTFQDEYGMNREEGPLDWSNDPRSESFGEAHFGKGPKEWMSDQKIRERASDALYMSREVDASEIDVTVEDGCIILKGTVDDRRQKKAAERTVEHLLGVVDVRNEITISR